MSIENYFGSVIHSHAREGALADGDLVDVSYMAGEARFRIPVALTRAAWAESVEWDDDRPEPQDEDGRLWDVLYMAGIAAGNAPGRDRVSFRVYRVPNEDRGRQWNDPELIELALHIGRGDEAEPVVTIMLPHED
ncbi:hypothetical protein O5Y58_17135 [Microbacterium paraoxydans]|uniref:DUF6573 family protein n=1 Tax=Microbacterium paraoxydans TaxID=199592 RepID=UPI00352E83C0